LELGTGKLGSPGDSWPAVVTRARSWVSLF